MDQKNILDNSLANKNIDEIDDSSQSFFKLYQWAKLDETLESYADFIPILVKRFSQQIINQYSFHKNIPIAMFPIHHIIMTNNLKNVTLSQSMARTMYLTRGNRLALDQDKFFDVIYQYSIYFNLKILEHRLRYEVRQLNEKYLENMRNVVSLLKKHETPKSLNINLYTDFEKTLQQVLKSSRELDVRLQTVRNFTAILSPSLAQITENVESLKLRLDQSIFN